MSAIEALKTARAAGVRFSLKGDSVALRASQATVAAVAPGLRRYKADIVTLLWSEFFEERRAALAHCGLTHEEARRAAMEGCITRWLQLHPFEASPSDGCAWCGKTDSIENLIPVGTASHVWLHDGCWPVWRARRRATALAALEALCITRAGYSCTRSRQTWQREV